VFTLPNEERKTKREKKKRREGGREREKRRGEKRKNKKEIKRNSVKMRKPRLGTLLASLHKGPRAMQQELKP
jgi:hypothetical protein